MLAFWKNLPKSVRQAMTLTLKAVATIGAFYLLLMHRVPDGAGGKVTILQAITDNLSTIELGVFVPFILVATLTKSPALLMAWA